MTTPCSPPKRTASDTSTVTRQVCRRRRGSAGRELRAGALAADVAAHLVPTAADAAVPVALEVAEDRVVADVVPEGGVVVEVEVVADHARGATSDVGRRQAACAADAEGRRHRAVLDLDVAHDDAVADDVQARVDRIERAGGVGDLQVARDGRPDDRDARRPVRVDVAVDGRIGEIAPGSVAHVHVLVRAGQLLVLAVDVLEPRGRRRTGDAGQIADELVDVGRAEAGREVVAGPGREAGERGIERVVAARDVVERAGMVLRDRVQSGVRLAERAVAGGGARLIGQRQDAGPLGRRDAGAADDAVPSAEDDDVARDRGRVERDVRHGALRVAAHALLVARRGEELAGRAAGGAAAVDGLVPGLLAAVVAESVLQPYGPRIPLRPADRGDERIGGRIPGHDARVARAARAPVAGRGEDAVTERDCAGVHAMRAEL